MEVVKLFNSELSSLYDSKPPISKAKMTSITRTAIKAIKLYKHVVQSVEKFIQKCKPEYKVPGLYVIDSIVRQSRHQFGTEKDVFAPRFARNLQQTFVHLFNCPPEDKSKVIRVLNLWQKNAVFDSEVIQPLFDLADPNHPLYKEVQVTAVPASNGITPVKPVPPANVTPKNVSSKKEGSTAGWVNQINTEPNVPSLHSGQSKSHAPPQVDATFIQQLQQLQTLFMDQQQAEKAAQAKDDQIKFDKKLLDFDYGEEEDEDGTPAHHHQQHQAASNIDSIGSILSNPEILRQLQTLQQTLSNPQHIRQQQLDLEEKMRKMQEMKQQEEEFDKHLAQTVPNLPFADECDLKPGGEIAAFPATDFSQPPPGYPHQQKMVMPGMMMKPPPSPLEDGEHASSDADDRMMGRGEEGGPSVVVLDSDSPNDSPAHRRRRRRSRSRSHSRRRSRSDSRSRSRNKRKRSSSYDDKDWEKAKMREAEKEKERDRKRKGLPPIKKNHLGVCSTTLWIGHLSKLVQQEELSDTFGEYGDIVSIDLIPPRGCAFICMNRRQDSYRALQDLKHCKLQGKTITLAWAPGKGMKGREYKDYWEVEQGVSYIPWIKLTPDIDLELLEEGGMIDEESLPEWLNDKQKKHKEEDNQRSQSSSQAEEDDASKRPELDIPVPAPTLPGFIPLPDGPQPRDIKVNPPPNMPPPMMTGPPLGMMPPPFGMPNVPRLLGPMGMAMGPGLMPNVPLGVPPPGMQGLMGNPLMHQQMMGRMPQPVGSPFNAPPGVSILGGHPQLSQIPLPGSQDKGKPSLPPLGVPPPSDGSGLPPFGDPMMQIPFTLPPQLQMPGMSMLGRGPLPEKHPENQSEDDKKDNTSPSRNNPLLGIQPPFGQPPPQFSPMSLMKIPPPLSVPPTDNKSENANNSDDKEDREGKDRDYREKDYKDRDKDRDRDYRNKRDRDYRGDRDYRDRFDKDYRDRDKEYRDRRDKRDRSKERDKDDKLEDMKIDEKDKKDDISKDDKNYRDRNDRGRSRNRDRDRDRGRDRGNKWGDRDRDRGRDRERDDRRGRDRERDRSKDMKGGERDKASQDRQRHMGHDQERGNEFSRGVMESENFQGRGGPRSRNEPFHPDGFSSDLHGRHHGNRREAFDNRGPRDMFDHRGPPPGGFDPRGPPPDVFGPRGPPPDGFGPRGSHPDGFGPTRPPPDGFGHRGPPPDGFGPRGPPDGFDSRGPPDGFNPRGPPPDGFDPRGPPPGGFGPDGFDPRGPPPDFDGQGPAGENYRGPPPDNFSRGEGFGPPSDNFSLRGPPGDEFGHPFEGFNGPPGDFQPRIRIEFFNRGRGRGLPLDSFRGRGGRGGPMFSPRGAPGPRGPRPGAWMEAQGPSPPKSGFGFLPPRGFAPPENGPERFGSPVFEDASRVRGGPNLRGRGRGVPGRQDDHRREEDDKEMPSPKRISRWSNPSPPPGYVPPGVEPRMELEPESRLRDGENTNSSENMDLVQQESNDGNAIKEIEEDTSLNAVEGKSVPDLAKPEVGEECNNPLLEHNTESQSFLQNEPSRRASVASHQDESNAFLGICNDSSSLQLSNIDSIQQQDASLLFTQDSQSMTDVEMSDSHSNFESSNKNEQESIFDTSKNNETAARSFAEVVSFTENNDHMSSLRQQSALSRSEENLSKFMNPPAELFDDSINKETISNNGARDQVLHDPDETSASLPPTNFDFANNIGRSETQEEFPAVPLQLNFGSNLPDISGNESLLTNTSLYDEADSTCIDTTNQNATSRFEESLVEDELRGSLGMLSEGERVPAVSGSKVQSDNTANEPSSHMVEFRQGDSSLPVSENTLSEESSAVVDPSVLQEQSNS